MWRDRGLTLGAIGLIAAMGLPTMAQSRIPQGSGTPVDIGHVSPSRDWINRSPTAGPSSRSSTVPRARSGGHHVVWPYRGFGYSSYYGPIYGGYWAPVCPYCGNYWCDGWCYGGPVRRPPVFVDAGQHFGPRAVQQFLLGGAANPAPAAARAANEREVARPAPAVAPPARLPPRANAPARERAITFVQYGDRHFQAGRYREALVRYKKASAAAAALAEAEFRQAFAELMLGQFANATQSIRRGLAKKPGWPDADFAIDDLLDPAAKTEAYRILRSRLQATNLDADAHFLLGVLLHFDGRPDAAQGHFLRTIELMPHAEYVRAFFTEQPEAGDAAVPAQ